MSKSAIREALRPLSSLRLTVALLLLSMLLVFGGTWAQAEQGLWTVLSTHFRAWVAPFQVGPVRLLIPGGYTLGCLLLANLLAAHALRFQLAWRRAGVLLIHSGLVLLLVGELVTSQLAVEARMEISEGRTVDFASDLREVELVLVDPSRADRDVVVAIPQARLVKDALIVHPLLPCDLRVVAFYKNSRLFQSAEGEPIEGPQPDAGSARGLRVEEAREVAGAGGDGVDIPSALIRLEKGGAPQGTWLASAWLDEQPLPLEGKTWGFALRFRRHYKPWQLTLDDFRHDRYTGTSVAKNFASHLRLLDRETGEERQVVIAMNEPLRYRGETLYQSAFKDDDRTTILQVVRNPGWTLPYIAVAIGALGMLIHFGQTLSRFLRRERRIAAGAGQATSELGTPLQRALPWVLLGLCAAWTLWGTLLRPAPDYGPWALDGFARLPVSYGGRLKPLDTVARNAATAIYGSDSLRIAPEPGKPRERVEPIEWLIHTLARNEQAAKLRVFRVTNPDVLGLLGLPREPDEDQGLLSRIVAGAHPRRYSLDELLPHRQAIFREAQKADAVESRKRDPFQRAILELHGQLALWDDLVSLRGPHPVPPIDGAEDWQTLDAALARQGRPAEAVQEFVAILRDYHKDEPARFGTDLERWQAQVALEAPAAVRAASVEVAYHRADPFGRAKGLFLFAALLVAGGWLGWRAPLHKAALGLLVLAVVVLSVGLCLRIWLMGRPPVTNLYSSALFVGWGVALASLLLERLFQGGVGTLVGALAGWLSLVLSGGLAGEGDTMAVLQAVLDTNFWLATHVVVITLGYAACFLAGLIAIVALTRGLATRSLDTAAMRQLASMTYGVVCFATLASFVGTILGGIWADQSWGRFWGWDPKENGALLIVLWNAVILHARWGGLVRERGLFLLAIGGNVVTSWSWFGTNMLGVGLHAYGFMDQALFWLLLFMGSQLALIAVGLVPTRLWRSDPWAKLPPEPEQKPAEGTSAPEPPQAPAAPPA